MKKNGEYRTGHLRPAAMPSVECPIFWGEWKCISHCLACDFCTAGRWKADGLVEIWCVALEASDGKKGYLVRDDNATKEA